jgi:hypothetical protein
MATIVDVTGATYPKEHDFLAAIVPAIGYGLDGLRANRCARLLSHAG